MTNPYLPNGIFLASGLNVGYGGAWNPHPTGGQSGLNPHPTGGQHAWWNPNPTGGQSAGWNPDPRKRGSRNNPDPIGGDMSSLIPGPSDSASDVGPRWPFVEPATASPWPWRDFDPAWVYSGQAPLMAQALRKVQARLVGERDRRLDQEDLGHVAVPASQKNPLWRWQSEYRQQAVVTALLNHTLVYQAKAHASSVFLVTTGNGPMPSLGCQELIRIEAPTGKFSYELQIDKVLRAAVEREERLPEILSQMVDFRPFFYRMTGLDRVATDCIDELILVAWAWATHILMALKNNLGEYRPVQRSALVVPIIPTPGHGSLPSGHATVAALTAELLAALLYGSPAPASTPANGVKNVKAPPSGKGKTRRRELLHQLASRIAFNRVVAGVHFPMDSFVGRALGTQLAHAFVTMAQPANHGTSTRGLCRQVPTVTVKPDSEWDEGADALPLHTTLLPVPSLGILRDLWDAAARQVDIQRI